jgi:hypothetical protein
MVNKYRYIGSEVLVAVAMKISFFLDITPWSPLKFNQRFEGTCRLHLQGPRINQGHGKHSSACHLLNAGFLLGLFFDPEDGGDMLLRNIG